MTYRITASLMAALLVLLAACSTHDGPSTAASAGAASSSRSASDASSPSATTSEPDINPCDGVDAAAVARVLGAQLRKETGTADSPRCALLPVTKGGPTFELSYLWFDQGLEAAWSTMKVPAGTVSQPKVAGADDARLVVNSSPSAYAVSAFLQNGKLIQTVNALALPPYDGPRVLRATRVLLGQLSAARS
ncbi:hypothetical protein JCM18899A_10900 [Nocardioides sp. AN3]